MNLTHSSSKLSRQVVELDPSSGSAVQCIMEWESAETFQRAVTSEVGIKIMGDIPNYTKGKPTSLVGKVVGKA
jgi:hypothetical protein